MVRKADATIDLGYLPIYWPSFPSGNTSGIAVHPEQVETQYLFYWGQSCQAPCFHFCIDH